MSNALIAFLVAIGASAWIYSKVMRTTGGNMQSSLTVAGICGVLLFFVTLFVAGLIS